MTVFYGYNPPFIGGKQKIMSRQEDDQLIKNDILQLLLTIPGERVNRPDFGTRVRSFVFENNTPQDIIMLEEDVRSAIQNFEPRVDIEFLEISTIDDDHRLSLKLVVTIKKDPQRRLIINRFIGQQ